MKAIAYSKSLILQHRRNRRTEAGSYGSQGHEESPSSQACLSKKQSHKAAAGLAHWLRSSPADATTSSASAKSSSPSCCHERAGDKLHAGIHRMEPSQLGKGWEGTPLIRYSGCWQT